jgi:hypothetical protein
MWAFPFAGYYQPLLDDPEHHWPHQQQQLKRTKGTLLPSRPLHVYFLNAKYNGVLCLSLSTMGNTTDT